MPDLHPSQRPLDKTVYQWVASTLRDHIAEGIFPPGSELPSEQDLAVRFQVSRDSLRAGLAVLRTEGLLDSRRGARPRVRQPAARTPVTLVAGEVAIARMPSLAERVEHDIPEGVPVIVVADRVYLAHQVSLTAGPVSLRSDEPGAINQSRP